MSENYPPIADLIVHQPPMRLLDALVHWAPGEVRCTASIQPDTPCVRDGKLGVALTLEHMAQSIAVCIGYEAYLRGDPPVIGMVVACRNVDFQGEDLAVGETLRIDVMREQGDAHLSRFRAETRTNDGLISTAQLTVVSEPSVSKP